MSIPHKKFYQRSTFSPSNLNDQILVQKIIEKHAQQQSSIFLYFEQKLNEKLKELDELCSASELKQQYLKQLQDQLLELQKQKSKLEGEILQDEIVIQKFTGNNLRKPKRIVLWKN